MRITLRKHEKFKEFIGDLIKALADELNINIESSGSTTWKRKQHGKGTEPGLCFHIANAERVIAKDELDLQWIRRRTLPLKSTSRIWDTSACPLEFGKRRHHHQNRLPSPKNG